jgi:hypothetical protein
MDRNHQHSGGDQSHAPGNSETPLAKGRGEQVTQGHRRLLNRHDRLTLGLTAGLPNHPHPPGAGMSTERQLSLPSTNAHAPRHPSRSRAGDSGPLNADLCCRCNRWTDAPISVGFIQRSSAPDRALSACPDCVPRFT